MYGQSISEFANLKSCMFVHVFDSVQAVVMKIARFDSVLHDLFKEVYT